MTKQEAIDFVKKYHGCHNADCDYLYELGDYCEKCEFNFNVDDFNPAMKIAIECIEKQMPKKQIEKFDNNRRLYCSTCGAYHGIYGDIIIPTSSKYCCWCGQAIDWSDEE